MVEVYAPKNERRIQPGSLAAQDAVAGGKRVFNSFAKHSALLDLGNTGKILEAHRIAGEEGVFEAAKGLRELFFGRDITFYGVVYISDKCNSGCKYCNGASNHKFRRRSLSLEEFEGDAGHVLGAGHKHICLLSGDHPTWNAERLAQYVSLLARMGVAEIILNIPPQTEEGFRILRAAAPDTPLQFRVFQETYDRGTYRDMHPWGNKRDYDFRYDSQVRALDAGFDNVGLGFLAGLHRFPIEEILAIAAHAELIHSSSGVWPARIALPAANQYGEDRLEIPFLMPRWNDPQDRGRGVHEAYAKITELIYALTRLAVPHISIVASERDPPELLKVLFRYASNCTMFVQAGVGQNTIANEGKNDETPHFMQCTTYPQAPDEMRKLVEGAGYGIVL